MKKKMQVKVKKRVVTKSYPNSTQVEKANPEDKMARVMGEFKAGKLKTSAGKPVTDRAQALAIALSEAGISEKQLQKAELISKIKVYKSKIYDMYMREVVKSESAKSKVMQFFKEGQKIDDDKLHAFAEKHGFQPAEIENIVYNLLSSFMSEGLSAGGKPVDTKELSMGIKVEMEHTDDPDMAEKIARDHLAEDENYYTELKKVER